MFNSPMLPQTGVGLRPVRGYQERTGKALEAVAERVRSWYAESRDICTRNANRAYRAEAYYHVDQLTPEQRQELADRGQPDIIFDRISPSVDVVLGTERRARTQPEYLPRGQFDEEKARIITSLSRNIEDENGTKYECSDVFQDGVIAGGGWLFQGENPIANGPRILERFVPWEEMIFDQSAKRPDLADARWLIRHRWHRAEEVLAWMPEHRAKLLSVIGATGLVPRTTLTTYAANGREEVNPDDGLTYYSVDLDAWDTRDWLNCNNPLDPWLHVGECWYKEFSPAIVIDNPRTGRVEIMDEKDPSQEHLLLLFNGLAPRKSAQENVRLAFFVGPLILSDTPSPYRHGDFPYTPFLCYRDRRTKKLYGVVERMIDPQDVVNRSFSRLFHLMSTRQLWIETGAAENIDDVALQGADPNGVIQLNPGGLAKYKIEDGGDRIRQYQVVMEMSNMLLGENTGTNDEMMGRESNARTGVAIDKRIERGSTILGPVFDNYYRFKWRVAKKRLSLIKQYIDGPTAVKITDEQGAVQYVTANAVDAYGNRSNTLYDCDVDVVINETPERATQRQAMAETMLMIAGRLPEDMQRMVLPLAVEMSDVPNKQEWLRRLSAMQMIPPAGLNAGLATAA